MTRSKEKGGRQECSACEVPLHLLAVARRLFGLEQLRRALDAFGRVLAAEGMGERG